MNVSPALQLTYLGLSEILFTRFFFIYIQLISHTVKVHPTNK